MTHSLLFDQNHSDASQIPTDLQQNQVRRNNLDLISENNNETKMTGYVVNSGLDKEKNDILSAAISIQGSNQWFYYFDFDFDK